MRIALALTVVALAYEWGVGNETVTPWLLARVINGREGAITVPATAAVGFGFTVVQQLSCGLVALAGFSMFRRTALAAWTRLARHVANVPGVWHDMSWPARAALVFGLGTTAVALAQVIATGETGVRRHARAVISSSLLCGSLVAAIGALAALLAVVGRQVDALAGPTDELLRFLANPLLWLGLLLVGAVVQGLRHRGGDDPTIAEIPNAGT
jgi:hypothetical protein